MRVAYLLNRYPRTSHSFIRREIRALERQGVEVRRFSLRPLDEPLPTEADQEELERTRIVQDVGVVGHIGAVLLAAVRAPLRMARAVTTAVRLGRRSDRGIAVHLAYLAEAAVVERWCRDFDVDHVHAHFGTNAATVAMLSRRLGGPGFSFTVHGPEEFDKPEFLKLGEKVRNAGFVVAISDYGRSQLYRWTRQEDWEKIHVVRCGLDEEQLLAEPLPVPATRRLVSVGRLSEQKGQLLLVEAARRLDSEGLDFEVVIGGDGPLRGQIESAITRHGLGDRVRLAGWMSEGQVREAIVESRALVLPSFAEGLPVTIMEAFALGRPVIATAIAGVPELVRDGVSGWIVPAGSVEGLVVAMRSALTEAPARLEEMGRSGASAVRERHRAASEAARLEELFRSARPGAAGNPA
jgi:glycosyltransferase involved in cell wall biosynthesis